MSTRGSESDREAVLREKRGQGLVARDLVRREGDHFIVTVPSLRGKRPETRKVSRDEQGRVICSCPQFELESKSDQKFRCEHIYAVKYAQARKGSLMTETRRGDDNIEDHRPDPNTKHETEAEKESDSVSRDMRTREIEAQLNRPPVENMTDSVASGGQDISHTRSTKSEPSLASTTKPPAQVISIEFASVLRTLRQPVDPKLVKTREGWTDRRGDTHMVEYVEWHTVADILDRTCPTWSHAVRNMAQIGSVVAVTAALTINGVTREGVGTGAAESEMGIKKAEHDALKRAAVKFGVARELYRRETELAEGGNSNFTGAMNSRSGKGGEGFKGFPQDPIAKGTSDLVTPKQLGMIRALAREAGLDAEKECLSHMKCKPEDLSKRAASSLIDYLKDYPQSLNKTERQAG
jgi:hypothetical protein